MKLRFILLLMVVISILTIYLFPDTEQFSVYNYEGTGLSSFYRSFNNVSNSNVTFLIILDLNHVNYSYFSNYIDKGGTLIISGNYTLINIFLRNLNINAFIVSSFATDNLNYYHNNQIIIANSRNFTLIFPYAHNILGGFPILTINGYTIIAYVKYGLGKIIIISSEYFFINKYYTMYDNSEYLHNLAGTDNVRIIIFNKITPLDYIKKLLYV